MNLKNHVVLAALLAANAARATLYSYDFTTGFANGGAIPDGNPTGWSDTRSISVTLPSPADGTTTEITDVNVRLTLSGGYNGDLYGYLVHSSGFAVLLNRSGRTSGNPFGYGDAGMNITLDDQAATTTDLHLYQTVSGYSISGGAAWRPDGRNVDPATVLDSDSRGALLTSFNTFTANGNWTLFLADFAGGDTSTVTSWGLDISVVPEPTTWALMAFAGLGATVMIGGWMRRRIAQAGRLGGQRSSLPASPAEAQEGTRLSVTPIISGRTVIEDYCFGRGAARRPALLQPFDPRDRLRHRVE